MAMIHTFEADTAPITIDDLFNVNDYYGIKLFGDAWNDVKKAACIIAQKAANAPIMFYLRSFANESTPGQHNPMSAKLWGYNDNAGVALLGGATWDALKGEFDELLGWNPFSAIKSVVTAPSRAISYVAKKIESTKIPGISEAAGLIDKMQAGTRTAITAPTTFAERSYNAATGQGFNTAGEIAAQREREAAKNREQMMLDQTARASAAAAAAAKAQAEYEKAQAELTSLENVAKQVGLTPASEAANATSANTVKTALIVGGGVLAVYLLTRKKGKK